MNYFIRAFGWLLVYAGSALTLTGVIALTGTIHIQIEAVGINLDRISEQIVWITMWLVLVTSGILMIALTKPGVRSRTVSS